MEGRSVCVCEGRRGGGAIYLFRCPFFFFLTLFFHKHTNTRQHTPGSNYATAGHERRTLPLYLSVFLRCFLLRRRCQAYTFPIVLAEAQHSLRGSRKAGKAKLSSPQRLVDFCSPPDDVEAARRWRRRRKRDCAAVTLLRLQTSRPASERPEQPDEKRVTGKVCSSTPTRTDGNEPGTTGLKAGLVPFGPKQTLLTQHTHAHTYAHDRD